MTKNPKEIASLIANELTYKSDRQPGALMLSGGWGAGKTHFWRTEMITAQSDQPKVYVPEMFGNNG